MTAADLVQVLAIQSVQLAVVIVAVGALATTLGRRRPHLAHALWLVVLLKCFTPPWLASPTSAFGRWQQRSEPPAPVVAAAQRDANPEFTHRAANGSLATDRAEPDTVARPTALTVPTPAPRPRREWLAASWPSAGRVIGAWVAGMIAVCGWLIVKLLRLRHELHAHSDLASPELHALVAKLAAGLRLRRGVRILVSRRGLWPAAFDGLRPTIIIPAELAAASQPAARDAMLAHELVHLRRGDFWLGLAQLAAQTVWWFHPLVWWANRQMRRERERACDAEVLAAGLSEPAEYARALVSVLEWQRRWQPQGLVPGIGLRDVTATRLALILRSDAAHRRRTSWWAVAVAAALAVVVLPGAAPPIAQGEPQIAQTEAAQQNAAPQATEPATSGEQPVQAGVSGSITIPSRPGLSITAGSVGLTLEQGYSSDTGSLVWGTLSAYPTEHPEPSAQHQAAVKKLTALGARVARGFLQPLFRSGRRFGYHLLVDDELQVTDDWLPLLRQMDSLDAIRVYGNTISPEQLAGWAAIPTVESLVLFQVRDAHLAALATSAGPKRLLLYLDETPDPAPSLARLQGVTDLMLINPHRETLTALPAMSNLRSLSLQLVEESPDDFERLGQAGTLERLMATGPQRSLAKLVPLGKLTKLKELSLIFSEAAKEERAADFTWLEKLTALEAVQLFFGNGRTRDYEIGPELTQSLAKLPALRAAGLHHVTDAGLAALCQSKTVRTLVVLGEKQSPSAAGLARLADLKTLDVLKVHGSTVDDNALQAWGTLPNLLWLEVVAQHDVENSDHVTDAGLLGLRSLTKLGHLNLHIVKMHDVAGLSFGPKDEPTKPDGFTDDGMAALENMAQLDTLRLTAPELTDRGLQVLTNKTNLVRVTLNAWKIGDEGLATLARLPRLRELSLFDAQATGAGLAALPENSPMTALVLDGCPVNDAGASHLIRARQLRTLHLARTKISDNALRTLAPLTLLESLTLDGTRVTDDAIGLLDAWLKLKHCSAVKTSVTKAAAEEFNARRGKTVVHTEEVLGLPFSFGF